ncbi:flavodoxin domain-containing protein [Clostridium sp. 'deep sea']|uniref:flavodoxin domain-containing protein n=1 Tax=Clostridium sp. 'deep sea' TaxID=2779445 RepID=UPI00189697D3|nr:flavodoxin domain-containing protein [Clostridium sp. 'deep sea']QOR35166.1 flavodoxin domain-containing protein [Clostridium sp. 'deep sea']
MNKKVLVAYGSKRGSTAEIAEKIGERLKQKGFKIDVLDAGKVKDLTPYNKIILGSSVYIGFWHKKAVGFLKKNIASLEKLPVWLYICGPTSPGDPIEQINGRFYPKSLQPVIERIRPQEITCFGGKLVLKTLNPFEKWIVKNVKATEGDFRDWQAITSWADNL